jgi:hypothetical protein
MATEILEPQAGEVGDDKETLYLLSGVALMVFGAGLILSNSMVRRYLSQVGAGDIARALMPDMERYFKLRSM